MKCYEVETTKVNTAGQKEKVWVCYCGTTACLQTNKPINYSLLKDLKKECYGNCYPEISKEDKDVFYKMTFKNTI